LCPSARTLTALAAAAAIGPIFGGCGGDDEDEAAAPVPAETVPTHTVPTPVTTPPPETTPTEREPGTGPATAPGEGQQGDEEAIRSEAVFTGRAGRLTPREVRVPAFIAVRVILRSAGGKYSLAIGGRRLAVGDAHRTAKAELSGLLPNKAYTGRSPQGGVRIVASAEPGP
jgi:hypothetical protein